MIEKPIAQISTIMRNIAQSNLDSQIPLTGHIKEIILGAGINLTNCNLLKATLIVISEK